VKKASSILLLFLLLMSVINLSFAVHYCGGEIAGRKVSFSGKTASCGMDMGKTRNSDGIQLSKICSDEISFLQTDGNYMPSVSKSVEIDNNIAQAIHLPVYLLPDNTNLLNCIIADAGPPDPEATGDVDLAGICIFRI
jgi:hypothetical protein